MIFACLLGKSLKRNVVINLLFFVIGAFCNGIEIFLNLKIACILALFIAKVYFKCIKNNAAKSL